MTDIRPTCVCFYAKFDGTNWVEFTDDVIRDENITVKYGLPGNRATDRVAQTGSMDFYLDNSGKNSAGIVGYYSPGSSFCRAGFDVGLKIKLVIEYDNHEYVKFTGTIPKEGIKVAPFTTGTRKTRVTVTDYMEQFAIHDVNLPSYTTNKTLAEMVALLLANMPIQPESTEYNTCTYTFPFVFDTVSSSPKALAELNKGALSEFGYAYLKQGGVLTIEGKETRTNQTENTQILMSNDDSGHLLNVDNHYILTCDGRKIVRNVPEDTDLTPYPVDMEPTSGADVYSIVAAACYPRKIDAASTTVLFSLNSAVEVAAGGTVTGYRGRYKDPTGVYKNTSGTDMQAAAGTTDYLMYQNADGTGTNLTANLTVTPSYGANEVEYTLVNGGTVTGYVTKLQARGKGVYYDDSFSYQVSDSTALAAYGSQKLSIDMKYQDEPTAVQEVAYLLIQRYKKPKPTIKWVKFNANMNSMCMRAFLQFDIGSRIRMTEDVSMIDDAYFIQSVDFTIGITDVINFTWNLKPATYDSFSFAKWDVGKWDTIDSWYF